MSKKSRIFAKKSEMNHGHCKYCYWFKELAGAKYTMGENGLVYTPCSGICYFQSNDCYIHKVRGESYCPDYSRVKKLRFWQEEELKKRKH